MSNTTTGEWTVRKGEGLKRIVSLLIGTKCLLRVGAKIKESDLQTLTDAHNAALAAEKLEVDERGRTIIHYKQQLAAAQAAMRTIQDEVVTLVDAEKYPSSVLHTEAPRRIKANVNAALRGDTTALDAAISAAQQPLIDALTKLVNRLEEIHDDEHYKSVWYSYANHGGDYTHGPTYVAELAAAKSALAKGREGKDS